MDEREFREYLDGSSKLSALYRSGEADKPSAGMDVAILAAARIEADAPTKHPAPRLVERLAFSNWPLPWVTAASAVGLLLLVTTLVLESDSPSPGGMAASRITRPASSPLPERTTSPATHDTATAAAPVSTPSKARALKAAAKPGVGSTPPPDTPQARLDEIERLLREGRQDEARVLFYLYRERYPAHAIPESLLPRLGM